MQGFHIFAINLPTDVDRRKTIERQLTALGATYEIAEGVFGNDERVTARYDATRAIKEHGKPLITGEKGCALAHALVYERIVKDKIPFSLILEDDIILPSNFLDIVQREIQDRDDRWDWLSFDYRYVGSLFIYYWLIATVTTIRKRPLFFFYACLKAPYIIGLSLFEMVRDLFAKRITSYAGAKRFYRPLYNAGAYILTLDGATKLLQFTHPLRLTADQVPNVARFKTNFNLYGYVPLIVKQNTIDFESSAARPEEEWEAFFKK